MTWDAECDISCRFSFSDGNAGTHGSSGEILQCPDTPLPILRHLERDVGVARVVDVEEVRVELDMAGLCRVLRRCDGRVREDLHGRVGLGSRERVDDGADDLVRGEGL